MPAELYEIMIMIAKKRMKYLSGVAVRENKKAIREATALEALLLVLVPGSDPAKPEYFSSPWVGVGRI